MPFGHGKQIASPPRDISGLWIVPPASKVAGNAQTATAYAVGVICNEYELHGSSRGAVSCGFEGEFVIGPLSV